jgi:GT2 family glycosyltransferase
MTQSRITVCINTKDRLEYLLITLSSLLSQTYQAWDLIIMDASREPVINDERVTRLLVVMKKYGHSVVYETDSSIGIPGSYQRMLEIATTELVIRQEDDIWMEPEMIERAHDVLCRPGGEKVGAVGFMTPNFAWKGHYVEPPAVLRNGFKKVFEAATAPTLPWIWEPNDSQELVVKEDHIWLVCTLHGGSLYRRAAAEAVGGFCTHFSPTGHREETLFYTRMYLAGWNLAVRSTSRLWHFESTSGGSRPDGARSDSRLNARRSDEGKFQAELLALIEAHPERLLYYLD